MKGLENLYLNNEEFKRYVDRYSTKHGKSIDQALKDKLVVLVAQYYIGKSAKKAGDDIVPGIHIVDDLPNDKSC